jgi:MFS family permease
VSILGNSPVLKIRDFRLQILGRASISMALQMQSLLVGWQLYHLKSNTLLLGLLGLAEAFPAISCSFFSGHAVDHHKPAFIYRLAITTLILNSTVLFFATLPAVPLETETRIIFIFVAVFFSGLARSFAAPSAFALMPVIVGRPLLGAAAAWNSSAFQAAAICGPILGGLIYGFFGSAAAFALVPFFAILAFVFLSMWSKEIKSYRANNIREPFTQSIQTGAKFVYKEKALLGAMSLDMFSVLFGGATQILPAYAKNVLMVGPTGLGMLRAAASIGSLMTAIKLAVRPMKVISGKTLFFVVTGFGISIIGFGLSTNFILSMVFLAFSGAFDGVSMIIRQTIMQLLTPDQMRGRVSAVSTVFITSSNEIGAFESGLAATLLGLVPSVVFGGAMTLVIVATMAQLFPELRKTRLEQ